MNSNNNHKKSPSQQLETVWDHLLQHNTSTCQNEGEKKWPHYKAILDDITTADYTEVLQCPHDIVKKSRKNKNFFGNGTSDDDTTFGNDGMSKAFCAHGAVVCAKIEMFQSEKKEEDSDCDDGGCTRKYTGLLSPGTHVENCILRFSTAMKPPAAESNPFGKYFLQATGGKLKHAVLFPMVAIKAFREGQRSGNLLFAGPKIVRFME